MGWVRVDANIRFGYGGGGSSGHDDDDDDDGRSGKMFLDKIEKDGWGKGRDEQALDLLLRTTRG